MFFLNTKVVPTNLICAVNAILYSLFFFMVLDLECSVLFIANLVLEKITNLALEKINELNSR